VISSVVVATMQQSAFIIVLSVLVDVAELGCLKPVPNEAWRGLEVGSVCVRFSVKPGAFFLRKRSHRREGEMEWFWG
jgi:hypothetical protein